MSQQNGSGSMAHDAELLSVAPGKMEGRDVLVLTIRPSPEQSFASGSFAISKEQAHRLYSDLDFIFQNYPEMRYGPPLEETPEDTPTEPPPKPPRKRKGKGK